MTWRYYKGSTHNANVITRVPAYAKSKSIIDYMSARLRSKDPPLPSSTRCQFFSEGPDVGNRYSILPALMTWRRR